MSRYTRAGKDAAARRRKVRAAELEARTPDDKRHAMIKAIIAAARDRGTVTNDDLTRAGFSPADIAAHFKSALALAKDAAPDIANNFTDA